MRITFILSSLWLSGGVRVVVEYANRLTRRGHTITLVAPDGTLDPDMTRETDLAVHIRQAKIGRPPTARQTNPWQMAALSLSLAQSTPPSDIIISTHTPTTIAGAIASHVLRRGKPVWFFQDYLEMFVDRPFETWLMKNAQRWQTRTLVVSNYSRSELLAYNSGDIIVVGEGLSHAEFFKPLPPGDRIREGNYRPILFLGDMRPRKGLYDFLEAAEIVRARVPEIFLWIVSKEDCHIQSDIPFRYIYRPSRVKLARLYASCDVFVSASWWESFGLPPLEAMACGAPVVMTDSRGVREFVTPGENCLFTPIKDPQALAEAVVKVLDNETLAEKLRANGPPTAASFTWSSAVERFESALETLL